MQIDRRRFIASLGGVAAVGVMQPEARADALEEYLQAQLQEAPATAPAQENRKRFPTVAELAARIETRPFRRGVGNLFIADEGNVARLQPLSPKPTLMDFFRLRMSGT